MPTNEDGLSADELYRSGKMPEMMRHWYSIRKQYPENYLLAYRMGDFYEFFYDDAIKVSKLLGLTLTKRGSGPSRHPLAGIPHKATQHFKTLVGQGQTVIIVEQLEDPKKAKGKIVKRGVVRILSPGTVIDDSLLDHETANYICAIVKEKKTYGMALLELSSGDYFLTEFYPPTAFIELISFIQRYRPVECILPQDLAASYRFMSELRNSTDLIIKEHPEYAFSLQQATQTLKRHFKVQTLEGFGIENFPIGIRAAGGLLSFLQDSQKTESLSNLTNIKAILPQSYMFLDANTQKNLELLQNQHDGTTRATLFESLHKTQTPMGTRLLKTWIVEPLLDKDEINKRLDRVQILLEDYQLRSDLRRLLLDVGDLARIITKINYSNTVNGRALIQLANALSATAEIKNLLKESNHNEFKEYLETLQNLNEVIELIRKGINPEPPITITEGNIIAKGYNEQVDEYRDILANGKEWIIRFENKEKQKLGISTGLKIGYNRVLGYYIQITENALKNIKLPPEYVKRQTLKGSIRFDTPALKEMETKILSAEENLFDIEYQLFQEIREEVQKYTETIQANATAISELDVIANFAEIAQIRNFCKPIIKKHKRIIISQGRHPVVEFIRSGESFVPNDTLMDIEENQILLITGPNWSGKSTYLRQVALITLMAQIGCYVPADSAEIGIIDRIFTRIGASDDLSRGQSTFMLEMTEMAEILHYVSKRSLVIIDELGRGTGTQDGQAISQAVLEYLHDAGVKTLFSTHFHQLINLSLPRIHNYHFKIMEKPDSRELVFLRQITDGGTDKSYGIHVAMMAGLPPSVIDRAFELMEELGENYSKKIRSYIDKENMRKRDEKQKEKGIIREEKERREGKETSKKEESSEENIISEDRKIGKNSTKEKENQNQNQNLSHIKKQNQSQIKKKKTKVIQTSLFPIQRYDDSDIIIYLRSLDLDHMTPIDAFQALVKLKQKIKNKEKEKYAKKKRE